MKKLFIPILLLAMLCAFACGSRTDNGKRNAEQVHEIVIDTIAADDSLPDDVIEGAGCIYYRRTSNGCYFQRRISLCGHEDRWRIADNEADTL